MSVLVSRRLQVNFFLFLRTHSNFTLNILLGRCSILISLAKWNTIIYNIIAEGGLKGLKIQFCY